MKKLVAIVVGLMLMVPLMGCDELLYYTIKLSNTGSIDIVGFYIAPDGQEYGTDLLPVQALEPGQYILLEDIPRYFEYDDRIVFDVYDPSTGSLFEREMLDNWSPPPTEQYQTWYGNCSDVGNYSLGYSWGWIDFDGEVQVTP